MTLGQMFEPHGTSRPDTIGPTEVETSLSKVVPSVMFSALSVDIEELDEIDGKEWKGGEYTLDDLNLSKVCY